MLFGKNYTGPLPHCECGKCNVGCFENYVKLQEKDNVFWFLNGLNDSYAASSHILMMKPFPLLDEAYNLILQEESQRSLQIHIHPLVENGSYSGY